MIQIYWFEYVYTKYIQNFRINIFFIANIFIKIFSDLPVLNTVFLASVKMNKLGKKAYGKIIILLITMYDLQIRN